MLMCGSESQRSPCEAVCVCVCVERGGGGGTQESVCLHAHMIYTLHVTRSLHFPSFTPLSTLRLTCAERCTWLWVLAYLVSPHELEAQDIHTHVHLGPHCHTRPHAHTLTHVAKQYAHTWSHLIES